MYIYIEKKSQILPYKEIYLPNFYFYSNFSTLFQCLTQKTCNNYLTLRSIGIMTRNRSLV